MMIMKIATFYYPWRLAKGNKTSSRGPPVTRWANGSFTSTIYYAIAFVIAHAIFSKGWTGIAITKMIA